MDFVMTHCYSSCDFVRGTLRVASSLRAVDFIFLPSVAIVHSSSSLRVTALRLNWF